MAVTDIVETKNGRGVTGSQTAWSTARNATTANASVYTSTFSVPNAIEAYKSTSRGPSVYGVTRTFFFFDLSSLPSGNIISAIDLKIQGFGSGLEGDGNVRVARATAFGGDGTSTYTATDFDNWSPSSPTPYASNTTTWFNVRNTITLNATAISDANTNGYLNLVLVDNVYDYPDTSPTSDDFLRNGIKFLSSTTSEKNIVTVTHAAAPSWEDTINGIPIKNQDKINGVLVSAIENVL
jgi:hypothetical protein